MADLAPKSDGVSPSPAKPPRPVKPLRLGTRQSPLAMAQAHEARDRLCTAHGWDEASIEIVPVLASGDKVLDRPLAEIGGKALWTKELDGWLHENRIDFAVHSMKDVETVRPDWLTIAALLPRADVRDVLVGARTIAAIPPGARVGTSAPRRAAQMLNMRPDLTVVGFRGNVATRLAKLQAGEADVTLLAAAGLERLGESGVGTPLDAPDWLPAPAQGAIGIECRTDDAATREALAAIDHAPTRAQVMAERALLLALGGNCHSPIAVWTRGESELTMTVRLYSPDGLVRVEGEASFRADSDGPARLAADLLADAPEAVAAHFSGASV
ncbi:hydroxymethylbilane synthase [Croceicoccus sp. BE223]|uniref:hydroxymethylbilane synthase n=1 Tax=Croceicoccus sp. BE223 TaxID=2817716 RepID=UPI00285A22F9|nr:hydroxymethylbilane synthase [Croceicoccus sp. BE223]MDR7104079.1 hydroxymethylbilane synthase [Croceicoccus sp. BE223]